MNGDDRGIIFKKPPKGAIPNFDDFHIPEDLNKSLLKVKLELLQEKLKIEKLEKLLNKRIKEWTAEEKKCMDFEKYEEYCYRLAQQRRFGFEEILEFIKDESSNKDMKIMVGEGKCGMSYHSISLAEKINEKVNKKRKE